MYKMLKALSHAQRDTHSFQHFYTLKHTIILLWHLEKYTVEFEESFF